MCIRDRSILGSTMGPRSALGDILDGLASGRFRPVIDRILSIEEIQDAHRLLEGREVAGKLVLIF